MAATAADRLFQLYAWFPLGFLIETFTVQCLILVSARKARNRRP